MLSQKTPSSNVASPKKVTATPGIPSILNDSALPTATAAVWPSIALETMNNINHPCVGINFDTANVHYHTNRKIDTVDEIQKILDYIRAVHLKDTMGGYHAWNFPALGEGIVNFKAVFELLNSRGFEGPFTMELEGIEGENIDRVGILKRVEDSFQYLKNLGVIH